jgi:hypothetical protein
MWFQPLRNKHCFFAAESAFSDTQPLLVMRQLTTPSQMVDGIMPDSIRTRICLLLGCFEKLTARTRPSGAQFRVQLENSLHLRQRANTCE